MVLTSRVTRVTRSPELALSTRPSGSRSTVRRRTPARWPAGPGRTPPTSRSARKVSTACSTTTPPTTAANRSGASTAVPAGSPRRPAARGSAARPARPPRPGRAARAGRRSAAAGCAAGPRRSAARRAVGDRQAALGVARGGEVAVGPLSRSRCRCRQARSRAARARPRRGQSAGTAGSGGPARQVSAEPGRPVRSSGTAVRPLRRLVEGADHDPAVGRAARSSSSWVRWRSPGRPPAARPGRRGAAAAARPS